MRTIAAPVPGAEAFVVELGKALLKVGTPAHRLEETLASVASRLGLETEISAMPTNVTICFQGDTAPRTYLVRSDPGEVLLEKIVLLEEATEAVLASQIDPSTGLQRVRAILEAPPRYSIQLTALAYGVTSSSLAFVFGGRAKDACVAGFIGLLTGLICLLAKRVPRLNRVVELAVASLAALVVHAAGRWLGPISDYLITVTGVIALVPGFTLTMAMTELSTQHLVSGTARLTGAGITFLKLGFGIALGGQIGDRIFGSLQTLEVDEAAAWIKIVALLVSAGGFTVIFQARPRDCGWILLTCALAIVGAYIGIGELGPQMGSACGAFLATMTGNFYGRIRGRSGRALIVPSLVLLVPGSVGFRSVKLLLDEDAFTGINTAFRMAIAAISLVAGILFANLVLPPRTGRKEV